MRGSWCGGVSLSSVPTFLPTKPLFKSPARAWTTGPSGLGRESERRPGGHKAETDPGPQKEPRIVLREALDSPRPGEGSRWGSDGRRHPPARQMANKGAHKGAKGTRHRGGKAPTRAGRLAASDRSCPSEHRDAGGREQPPGC